MKKTTTLLLTAMAAILFQTSLFAQKLSIESSTGFVNPHYLIDGVDKTPLTYLNPNQTGEIILKLDQSIYINKVEVNVAEAYGDKAEFFVSDNNINYNKIGEFYDYGGANLFTFDVNKNARYIKIKGETNDDTDILELTELTINGKKNENTTPPALCWEGSLDVNNNIYRTGNVGIGFEYGRNGTAPLSNLSIIQEQYGKHDEYNGIGLYKGNNQLTALLTIKDRKHGALELNSDYMGKSIFINSCGSSYFNGGNVGIGTSSPRGKLHIANGNVILQNESSGYPILWLKNVAGDNTVRLDYNSIISAGDNLYIRSGASHNLVLNDNGGNVGIGTSAPQTVFNIARNNAPILRITGMNNDDNSIIQLLENTNTETRFGFDVRYNGIDNRFEINRFNASTTPGNVFTILRSNGYVGIGTTKPTEKLTVKGTILASKIRVLNDSEIPASDYVFEPDYNLRSLKEVETFVKENKHLPEVPSAAEFKENGYSIGEMDDVLLRKIEELTLYMIEQEKMIGTLNERIRELEKINK